MPAAMILRNFKRKGTLLAQIRGIAEQSLEISSKTHMFLKGLPNSATEQGLKDALKDIKYRRLSIEPGCTFHVSSESAACVGSQLFKEKHNLKANVSASSLPSIILNNIPDEVSVESLSAAFKGFDPKTIQLSGRRSLRIHASSADAALRLVQTLETRAFGETSLRTSTMKLLNGEFAVNVYNFPVTFTESDARTMITEVFASLDQKLKASVNVAGVTVSEPSAVTASIRFANNTDLTKVQSVLSNMEVKGKKLQMTLSGAVAQPALFLRNLAKVDQADIEELFEDHVVRSLSLVRPTRERPITMAVAYFNSEADALRCRESLRNKQLRGKRLNVAYRETFQPAVRVSNVPEGVLVDEVQEFFKSFEVGSIAISRGVSTGKVSVTVTLQTPYDAKMACQGLNNKVLRNARVTVQPCHSEENGVEVLLPAGVALSEVEAQLRSSLENARVPAVGIVARSNKQAVISFPSVAATMRALQHLNAGQIEMQTGNSHRAAVTAAATVSPAFAVEVRGLKGDQSVASISDVWSDSLQKYLLKANRNALLKFTRNSDVLPGLKALEKVQLDGRPLAVERYSALVRDSSSEYDVVSEEEKFLNEFSLSTLMGDYNETDPAMRYQVAKNAFERALNDAKADDNIDVLLDSTVTKAAREEAAELLKRNFRDGADPAEQEAARTRLFQLFLQREDMERFTHNFRELELLLGPVEEKDLFSWSQFSYENQDAFDRFNAEMGKVEEQRIDHMASKLLKQSPTPAKHTIEQAAEQVTTDSPDEAVKELEIEDEGSTHKVSLEDPAILRDKDGNLWSGVIVDTDITQTTLPRNRKSSNRVLVVVGNMRGAAGYGKGKGETMQEALTQAFRAALRGLVHIDLYDNAGIAHDLHGKHNSCHCYIRATPESRTMVASPLATEILLRFGIGSASVKLVGRRDPYAQVKAIFNAIEKHENIDETAKERGKRYLTLKWAYDNNV